MKMVSFSLYGDSPKYLDGAIENAKLALRIYPGWECWFFVDQSVPQSAILALINWRGRIRYMESFPSRKAWRYLASEHRFDDEIEAIIFRDCDSRLNYREKAAVDEWLSGRKTYHAMLDHPGHTNYPMCGMWGAVIRDSNRQVIANAVRGWGQWNEDYATDTKFMFEVMRPLIEKDVLIHDDWLRVPGAVPFPDVQIGQGFVGEIYDEFGKPQHAIDRETREQAKKNIKI